MSLDTRAREDSSAPFEGIAVRCERLSRTFGNTRALQGVDLEIRPGTIHALVGQNGAGKSTCLGIIAGRIVPTSGDVSIMGETFHYGNPRAAQHVGVAAVYQELTIIPHLSPHANVFIAEPMSRWGFLQQRAMRKRYLEICANFGIPAAPDVPAGQLTVAQQQLIEVVRAVVADARIMLLDEPTAALAIEERRALYGVLRSLRDKGTTIILVSHNLEEVLENSDTVTVFRDGRLIETKPANEWTKTRLIENMLGDSSSELLDAEVRESRQSEPSDSPTSAAVEVDSGELVFRANNVMLSGRLREVNLEVRAGEVLGVAGLMGSGRSSLLRAMAGAEPGTRGELEIDGVARSWPGTPRAARSLGIGLIAEDRKTEGVCLGMSCAENVVLPGFKTLSRFGYLSSRRMVERALPLLRAVGVDVAKVGDTARTLSGGNQQKLLFARMRFQQPRILLADEPTRGVDVGAKTDILNEVRRLAHEDGVAVVFVSSELEEVLAFSDRILVMAEGRIVHEFDNRAGTTTQDEILSFAFQTGRASA
jgi:ABC-type sugar transport system ATPase subunit